MRFSKAFANKIFAANPLIIGTAILALAAFSPRPAFAQSFTLSPASAVNFAGGTHTVSGTVSGVIGNCAEIGDPLGLPDSDGSGVGVCTSDADCADPLSDDFCSFSGFTVGFVVQTGPNTGQFEVTTTDPSGSALFTVTDTLVGHDTIQGCLDTEPSSPGVMDEVSGNTAADVQQCITDGTGEGDFASVSVDKFWTEPLAGILSLSPLSAVNPDNPPLVATHTVTASIAGINVCTGTFDPGMLCLDDNECGGGTCTGTNPGGQTVLFKVTSGPNTGATGSGTVGALGTTTFTYTDTGLWGFGLAGLDTIQACLDLDDVGETATECLSETNNLDILASNPVTKRWDPTLLLQNQDAITTLFSTNPAFNPVGSSHTVSATIVGGDTICFGGTGSLNYQLCSTNTDCAASAGATCGIAGYPVFFGVTAGPNTGDLGGAVLTNSLGVATKSYTDLLGAGVDTIQSCVDADLSEIGVGGVADDTGFTECNGDYPGQADVPSNTVTKFWLTSFVTGGGKWTKKDKSWDSFGGTVGQKPGSTATVGEWDETAHASKGGNVSCHWNTLTGLKFSCTNLANCVTTPDTVQFVASAGKCSGAPSQTVTVTIVDGRKKPDTISVIGGSGLGTALNVNPPVALGTGNFTLHP